MNAVGLEVRNHVGWITLDRPGIANAIDRPMLCALDKALDFVIERNHAVRAMVLTGTGRHFCSGVDLRAMSAPDGMERGFLDHVIERLLSIPVPIVAAISGAAAGSGMTMALTADIILMTEDAFFLPSFIRLGLVPDNGITTLLSERVGAARARASLMLSERIEARKALDWGLAYEIVGGQALQARAAELAEKLAAGPRNALAATRMIFSQRNGGEFHKQLRAERSAHLDALRSQECIEGRAAFFEHREPCFVKDDPGHSAGVGAEAAGGRRTG